jgi:hypothetical protein
MVRQVAPDAVKGSFEPVASLSRNARAVLDRAGIVFAEEEEFDEPGPTQWAVVEVSNRQYLVVHHYGHPERFVELRASVDEASPAVAVTAFVDPLGLDDADVLGIVPASDWPPGARRR